MRKNQNPQSYYRPSNAVRPIYPDLTRKPIYTKNHRIFTKQFRNTILEIDEATPPRPENPMRQLNPPNRASISRNSHSPVQPIPGPLRRSKFDQNLVQMLEQRIIQSRTFRAWPGRHLAADLGRQLQNRCKRPPHRPIFSRNFYKSLIYRQQLMRKQARIERESESPRVMPGSLRETLNRNSSREATLDDDCEVVSFDEKGSGRETERGASEVLPTEPDSGGVDVQSTEQRSARRNVKYNSPIQFRKRSSNEKTPESVCIVDKKPAARPHVPPDFPKKADRSVEQISETSSAKKAQKPGKLNKKISKMRKSRKQRKPYLFGVPSLMSAGSGSKSLKQPQNADSIRSKNQPITNFFTSNRNREPESGKRSSNPGTAKKQCPDLAVVKKPKGKPRKLRKQSGQIRRPAGNDSVKIVHELSPKFQKSREGELMSSSNDVKRKSVSNQTLSEFIDQHCLGSVRKGSRGRPTKTESRTSRDKVESLSEGKRANLRHSPSVHKPANMAPDARLDLNELTRHVEQLKDTADLRRLQNRIEKLIRTRSRTNLKNNFILNGSQTDSGTSSTEKLWPFRYGGVLDWA